MKEMAEKFKQQLEMMGPYARQISTAMVILGQAVELALNMRDTKVIEEMKKVCSEIFEQAEGALKDEKRNLQ